MIETGDDAKEQVNEYIVYTGRVVVLLIGISIDLLGWPWAAAWGTYLSIVLYSRMAPFRSKSLLGTIPS